MSQEIVSFVLRFIRETGEDEPARWRGMIKHVQSDSESHFTQFAEALEFMQSQVNETIRATFADNKAKKEENPFVETARLWGEFMPRYTRLMMDSMQEMVGHNPALAQQMEKTMAAAMSLWGLAKPTEPENSASLQALTQQLATLTAKIEALETKLAEGEKIRGRVGE
ncbi:MAG: hypothetical protein KJ063_04515 [Anaerolineae bacterium]|nr:hypothetical protein [Anaerolineae bacterium]